MELNQDQLERKRKSGTVKVGYSFVNKEKTINVTLKSSKKICN